MPDLKFCSLNVRGFGDSIKRQSVYNILNLERFDIVFLQETHCLHIKEAKFWGDQYGGKAFWSFGNRHSCGVGILINSSLTFKVANFDFDIFGRYVILDVNINGTDFRLINVYMPNNAGERKEFISNLASFLVTKRYIILGGDINFVENLSLDKKGGNVNVGNIGIAQFISLKRDFNIIDAFRCKYGTKREFTWEGVDNGRKILCRLDRLYISRSLGPYISSVVHKPILNSISDHDSVCLSLNNLDQCGSVGPGFWKCNTSVLHDFYLKSDLFALWQRSLQNLEVVTLSIWDKVKADAKQLIIFHSKRLNTSFRLDYKKLQKEYFNLKKVNADSSKIQECENKINQLLESYSEGSKIRSKAQNLEFAEKPTRFFLNKETKRAEKRTLDKLLVDGILVNKQNEILKHVRDFYKQLFSKSSIDQSLVDYFLNDLKYLSDEQRLLCEGKLSKEECYKALAAMQNCKSPGIDGLPKEFYFLNWDFLGDSFVKMANRCFSLGTLSETQKLGVITLICKNPEKSEQLNYWRPISLLCVDYKIISKCVTNRLKRVMGFIVNVDQTSAVLNRSIQDNVHLIRNILDYSRQKNLKFILLSLDQSKAFDRVDHNFMFQALSKYGFGPDFLKWVHLLYFDIKSTVLVNGYFTEKFHIERSVRQGCSLSPLLYVLVIECFACKVRSDSQIKGFKIPGFQDEYKISQYADDCTFMVMNTSSVCKILNICEIFGLASGSKLNKEKSLGILIGNWNFENMNLYGLTWTKDVSKICGVFVGNGNYVSKTWDSVYAKFEKVISLNKTRNLRLRGKSIILNILGLSKLWYVGAVYPLEYDLLCKFEKLMFNFLWNNKTECLKREVLYNSYLDGGVALANIECKIKAFLVMHIYRFLHSSHCKWKNFAMYWLKLDLRDHLPTNVNLNNSPYSIIKPVFYDNALTAFKELLKIAKSLDFKTVTFKKAYYLFLQSKIKLPRILSVFPNIDFSKSFQNTNHPLLSPESRDVTYRITHHILPVNQYLYSLSRIVKSPKCILCEQYEESLSHIFFHCKVVNPTLVYISDLLSQVSKSTVSITAFNIVFNIFQESKIKNLNVLLLIILAEARWSIWYCRNLHKFQEKKVDSEYIKMIFKNNFKFRILADFKRLPLAKFQSIWCFNSFLCKVNEAAVEILF